MKLHLRSLVLQSHGSIPFSSQALLPVNLLKVPYELARTAMEIGLVFSSKALMAMMSGSIMALTSLQR